jgi:hypothetical protein
MPGLLDRSVLDVVGEMTHAYEHEELPLPLLRPVGRREHDEAEDDAPTQFYGREMGVSSGDEETDALEAALARRGDRLRPASAGAIMGFLAGAAGLGVVHAFHPIRIVAGIDRLATRFTIPHDAGLPLAYLGVAIGGALLGAMFGSITKNLRRSFMALLLWALVFFGSLSMLALAASSTYGRGIGVPMAPAILLATAAYAFIVSFQLPLRRRG